MRGMLVCVAVWALRGALYAASEAPAPGAREVSGAVSLLGADDLGRRRAAFEELLRRGQEDPDLVLRSLPEDPADIEVRDRCEELRARLTPVWNRWRALAAAGGDPRRRAAVETLFSGPSPKTVCQLAKAFGETGKNEASRILAPFLACEKREVAEAAFRSILVLAPSDKEVAVGVEALFTRSVGCTRAYAIGLLAELDAAVLVPRIADLLRDEDLLLRTAAVKAAGRLGIREHAPRIARLLSDPQPVVRMAAIEALVRLGAREHAPDIARLVEDGPQPELTLNVRVAALRAIVALGGESVIPKIQERLLDRDLGLREEAGNILVGLAARSAAPGVALLLQNGDEAIRGTAASVLIRLKEPSVVPQVIGYLSSDSPDVRAVAALTLGGMGASPAAREIAGLLADPEPVVQAAAVEALGDLGDAAFAPRVAAFLRVVEDAEKVIEKGDLFDSIREKPPIRGLAAIALGKMRAAAFTERIESLLQDEDCDVQEAAKRALADLKSGAAH